MPIIPTSTENVQMKPNAPVPIASTNDARFTGEAIQQFGQGVEKLGKGMLDMQRDINKNEGRAKIAETYQKGYDRAKREAKPDGSDLDVLVQKYTKDDVDKTINDISGWDPNVRRDLESFNTRVGSDVSTKAFIDKNVMLEQDNVNRIKQSGDVASDRVRENPNENLAGAEMRNFNALIDTQVTKGNMSADTAYKLKNTSNEKMALSYVDGLANIGADAKALAFLRANQEDTTLTNDLTPGDAQAMGFIDSREAQQLQDKGEKYKVPVMTKGDKVRLTPEMSALANSISPEAKGRLIDQLSRKAKEKSQLRMSDLNAQLSGFQSVALSGQPVSEAAVPKLIDQIDSFPDLPKVAKDRLKDQVYTAMTVNRRLQDLSSTPRSEWGNLLAKTGSEIGQADAFTRGTNPDGSPVMDFAIEASRQKAIDVVESSADAIRKQQDDDAAAYVMDNDRNNEMNRLKFGTKDGDPAGTAKYVNAQLAKQAFLEIPPEKRRILTKGEAHDLGQLINQQPDSQTLNNLLGNLEGQYGRHYSKIMTEVSATNKKAGEYASAAFAPVATRTALIDAIKNEKAINTAFSALPKAEVDGVRIKESIRLTTLGELNKVMSSASGDSSGVANVNTLQKAVELQVKSDMVQNPDADIEQLVKKAYDDLIGSQYHPVVSGGDRSAVAVPKTVAGVKTDPATVKSFINVYSQEENFKDLNVAVPKGYTPEQYHELLSLTGQWVQNDDGTGMRLIRVNPENGQRKKVLDKYGNEVVRTFDKITQDPGKKVMDDKRGFVGRMFDKANSLINNSATAGSR